jgi:ribonuclease HI
MTDDVAGFAVHNGDYAVGHQLAKSSSDFSLQISVIRMALEHIQICPRRRYLILSDSLSSQMAMRSRKITCKAHPWVYKSKQIYWDLQQLNYDVKLMWIPSHVGISGNKVADGLTRQAVESGTIHGQMTVAYDHWILARQTMVKQWKCWAHPFVLVHLRFTVEQVTTNKEIWIIPRAKLNGKFSNTVVLGFKH